MRKKVAEYTTIKKTSFINKHGEFLNSYYENVEERYNEDGFLYKDKTSFLKSFTDVAYPDELTWAEKGRLGRLEKEIKEDQILAYRSGNVIKPHSIESMSKILDCSPRQTTALIKKCKKLKVIGEAKIHGKRCYLLNPSYKLRGRRISLIVWIVFQEYFKANLPQYAYEYFLYDYTQEPPDVQVIK